METKTCTVCGVNKSVDAFYLNYGKPRPSCKSCCNKAQLKHNRKTGYKALHKWRRRSGKKHMAKLQVNYNEKRRREAVAAYGGKCMCPGCGEHRYHFLEFDHVNNDGGKHRKTEKLQSAAALVVWLKKNNWPNSIQLLCRNCNGAKAFYGQCPHVTEHQAILAVEAKYPPVPEMVAIN